ncbi:MAG: ketoacyl-ACP synthase III [Parachlamydiales bacterium]|nr:ketoacyl-ACP synthase III [Parachlamydiales bacterium]
MKRRSDFLKQAKIVGTGSYLPQKILTNFDLQNMVETSDEWIVTRTGIHERRLAQENEFTSTMGLAAAKKAIDDAQKIPQDIDCIIVATLTPDYIFPSTACLIQHALGINGPAFDMQAACSGYIYGLSIAKAFVENGQYKNVLIVASEKLSSIVDYSDRTTCVVFGDGAAACVVSLEGKGLSIDSVKLGASGEYADLLILPGGGCRHPATHETVDQKMHYLRMKGNEVFKHAIRNMESAVRECLADLHLEESNIDWLIPHQANKRIIDALAKRFSHLSEEKVVQNVISKYGNTSASSIGIALDELRKEGKVQHHEKIVFTAFGAGFTWGAAIVTNQK